MMGLYFGIRCCGTYSGAVLNPAVGISNVVVVSLATDTSTWKYLPAFIFGPIIGGALAASFTRFVSDNIVMKRIPEKP
jgi:glycerol uptake facilitator-like aquaporin